MASACLLHPQVDEDMDDVEKTFDGQQYHPNSGSQRLWEFEIISDIWPEKPPHNRLHVIVHLLAGIGSLTQVYDKGGGECFCLCRALTSIQGYFHLVFFWPGLA